MEQTTIPVYIRTRDVFRAMAKKTGLSYDELIKEMLMQFDSDELRLQDQPQPEHVRSIVTEQEIPEYLLEDVELNVSDGGDRLATT